jgi:hypothetical protein
MAKHRPIIWLVGGLVSLVLVGGFCLYAWKWQRETAIARFVRALPGDLTVGKVSADLFANNVTLDKLSGTVELFPDAPFDVRIERLRLRGLNMGFAESAGVVKVADEAAIRYMTLEPGENCALLLGYSFMNAGSYDIHGVWLDWSSLMIAAKDGPRSEALATFLLSLRLGPCVVTDASIKISPSPHVAAGLAQSDFLLSTDKWEVESYSLLRMGKSHNVNFSLIYADGSRFMAAETDFDSFSAPESLLRLMLSEDLQPSSVEQAWTLLQQGYSLRGLRCREAQFVSARGDRVRVPNFRSDIDIGNGKLLFSLQAPEIHFSTHLLAAILWDGPEHAAHAEASVKALNEALGKEARAALDIELKTQPGADNAMRVLFSQEAEVKNMGRLDLHFALHGPTMDGREKLFPVDIRTTDFDWGALELTDAGFLDKYYKASAALASGGDSPELAAKLRAADVASWRNFAATQPPSYRQALSRFADFLEFSGICALSVMAVKPLGVVHFTERMGDPAYLMLEAKHTANTKESP